MKHLLWIAACGVLTLSALVWWGCRTKEPAPETTSVLYAGEGPSITVVNELKESDFWILPDTEANRKTSLWGKAAIAGLGLNETCRLSLTALGGPGDYHLRAITPDGMYFSASGVTLEDGYVLTLKNGGFVGAYLLEVADADGVLVETYQVFGAAL